MMKDGWSVVDSFQGRPVLLCMVLTWAHEAWRGKKPRHYATTYIVTGLSDSNACRNPEAKGEAVKGRKNVQTLQNG